MLEHWIQMGDGMALPKIRRSALTKVKGETRTIAFKNPMRD